MITYRLKQFKNRKSTQNNKWMAVPVITETVDIDGLAEHMSSHNSPYSKGVMKGILTDMVGCIKEILLEGKNVKIEDLAIFSLGIKNTNMVDAPEEYTVSKNVKSIRLRARATGNMFSSNLNSAAHLKKLFEAPEGDGSSSGGGGDDNTAITEP